jgi:hypothetical protein
MRAKTRATVLHALDARFAPCGIARTKIVRRISPRELVGIGVDR